MKLIFASDSFKESLSSRRTAELLTRAAREVFDVLEKAKRDCLNQLTDRISALTDRKRL